MTIPLQVEAMLAIEGVYLVQHPINKGYSVVHVNDSGACEQMKFDGVLRTDGWHADVIIRGPLTLNDLPIGSVKRGSPYLVQSDPASPGGGQECILVDNGKTLRERMKPDRIPRLTTDSSDPRLTHGNDTSPVPQAAAYLVLGDEELAKGFVRPVRTSYKHTTCGIVTTMGMKLSETFARDPSFYGGTYCAACSMHRPVGEFRWTVDGEIVGS